LPQNRAPAENASSSAPALGSRGGFGGFDLVA
jgi:hypothetical protein